MVSLSEKLRQKKRDSDSEKPSGLSANTIAIPAVDAGIKGLNRSSIVNEKLLEIDPKQCTPWPFHNRHKEWLSSDRLDGLMKSIMQDGQLQPGLVRKTSNDIVPYEIIFGVRRWSACIALGKKFRARITTADDRDCLRLMHFENEESRNISPLEKAFAYADQLQLGLFRTQAEFADDMNMTVRHLSRLLRIASLRECSSVVDLLFLYVDQLSLRMVEEVARAVNSLGCETADHLATSVIHQIEAGEIISIQSIISILTQGSRSSNEKTRNTTSRVYLKQGNKTLVQAVRKPGEIKISLKHGVENSNDIEEVIQNLINDCRNGNF